jgi:hypothetical protein
MPKKVHKNITVLDRPFDVMDLIAELDGGWTAAPVAWVLDRVEEALDAEPPPALVTAVVRPALDDRLFRVDAALDEHEAGGLARAAHAAAATFPGDARCCWSRILQAAASDAPLPGSDGEPAVLRRDFDMRDRELTRQIECLARTASNWSIAQGREIDLLYVRAYATETCQSLLAAAERGRVPWRRSAGESGEITILHEDVEHMLPLSPARPGEYHTQREFRPLAALERRTAWRRVLEDTALTVGDGAPVDAEATDRAGPPHTARDRGAFVGCTAASRDPRGQPVVLEFIVQGAAGAWEVGTPVCESWVYDPYIRFPVHTIVPVSHASKPVYGHVLTVSSADASGTSGASARRVLVQLAQSRRAWERVLAGGLDLLDGREHPCPDRRLHDREASVPVRPTAWDRIEADEPVFYDGPPLRRNRWRVT